MDISYDNNEIIRRCFKCDEPVICNFNVVNNVSNTTFTLWNKFQIFVYENLDFESASKIIVPEFQIQNILMTSNYLMCVDYTGNVHTTSLKFKNTVQKRFKYSFQPRETGIVACSLFAEDQAICVKYEADAYFLNIYKINTEFSLEKRVIIMCNEHLPSPSQQTRDKYILKTYPINDNQIENVRNIFKIEDTGIRSNYSLVIISFDKRSVYGCLFSPKMIEEEVTLVKLYSCPSEISNVNFIELADLNIVIGLAVGTLIDLDISDLKTPKIIHLNTAIHNFLTFKDTILYIDGIAMWKVENVLSKNIKFSQLFVKDVKDFVKFGEQIICTTFVDLIYTFSIDDERSYIKPQSIDEYCNAEVLLDNSDYLKKIMDQVKKNENLIKMQIQERNYITALSLSNRQDVIDTIITQKVIVYDSYETVITENSDVILTNNFSEYFDTESFYFLIKITTMAEHRLHDVLSNSLGDLRIHITITSRDEVVKTTTVKVADLLKKLTLLIPLKLQLFSITDVKINLKIMTNMPGALDARHKIWTVLYRKTVALHSEHFIKFAHTSNKNICLRESKESIEELILQTSIIQHGSIFDFTDITVDKPELKQWQMYVRLPAQYQEVFQNGDLKKQLNSKKVEYFLQQFTSDDFLKSKSSFTFPIAKEKVKIEIDNDGFSNPSLKISSNNARITLDIRNFLSNLIYSVFSDFGAGKEFVNHSFYITVENLQKRVRECVTNSSQEEILPLIEQFERKIIGLLPI